MAATLADIQRKYGDNVYPLYKDEMRAPYMEKKSGYGYQGVVMYDENEDKVQCHICGKWFQFLPAHIKDAHGIDTEEYREKGQLTKKVSLCSKGYSKKRSKQAKAGRYGEYAANLRKGRTIRQNPKDTSIATKKAKSLMGFKNQYGYCDAQIAAALVAVRVASNKDKMADVTMGDIQKYNRPLASHLLRKYKNTSAVNKKINLKEYDGVRFKDAELLEQLREFVRKNKREPTTKDREKGIASYLTYLRRFGSFRKAKIMAGLDQLLQEVK